MAFCGILETVIDMQCISTNWYHWYYVSR